MTCVLLARSACSCVLFLVDWHRHVLPPVAPPLRRVPDVQEFTPNDLLAHLSLPLPNDPRILVSIDLYPSHHDNTPTTSFLTDSFSRSAGMHAAT